MDLFTISISKAEITDFIQQVFILNFYFWFIFTPLVQTFYMYGIQEIFIF